MRGTSERTPGRERVGGVMAGWNRQRAAGAMWRGLAVFVSAATVSAQPPPRINMGQDRPGQVSTPDLAEPVLKLLDATYLTDDERKDLRIFHGVWKEGDLDTPQRRARAALIRGLLDDPSLSDPAVSPEDRAEGALLRGDLDQAVQLVGEADSARSIRIRAQALEGLGKFDAAAAAIEPLVERLKTHQVSTPEELVELGETYARATTYPIQYQWTLLEGINDIGWPGAKWGEHYLEDPKNAATAEDLIAAYRQIIDRVHAHGAKVIGATLTPFEGTDLPGYYSAEKESVREAVNRWIRRSGAFDGVIDFDAAIRDPAHPSGAVPEFISGDHIHPTDAGYEAMGQAVPLELFH